MKPCRGINGFCKYAGEVKTNSRCHRCKAQVAQEILEERIRVSKEINAIKEPNVALSVYKDMCKELE